MFLDDSFSKGGDGEGPSCCACRQPILRGQHSTRVRFNNDPHGARGLTGDYHLACSKPFSSMAHIVNLDPRAGR